MEYKVRKNGFLTVVLSFLPGGGHMYLGLIKQGLEIMGIFFVIFFLSEFLSIAPLMMLYPILAFYSIFDALAKRASDFDDKEAHCDLVNWLMSGSFSQGRHRFRINTKIIGIAMIVIGGIIIFNNFLPYLFYVLDIEQYWVIMNALRTILLALCFIAGGIWLAFHKPYHKHDPYLDSYLEEEKDDVC